MADLRLIGLGVFSNLLPSQWWPRLIAPCRIAYQAGEITNQEDHIVTELLKMAHLPNPARL
jgi:hypothetical protein